VRFSSDYTAQHWEDINPGSVGEFAFRPLFPGGDV
jgi:hypothetical protein